MVSENHDHTNLNSRYLESHYFEILNVVLPQKPLGEKHLEILYLLLKSPGITIYGIFNKKRNLYTYTTSARRHVKSLEEMGMIEIMNSKYKSTHTNGQNNEKNPYELNTNGIFFLILNNLDSIMEFELIYSLLENYGSNALLEIYLYPFIKRNTIIGLKDDHLSSLVFEYLKSVCNTIVSSQKDIESLIYQVDDDNRILQELFRWPKEIEYESIIPFDPQVLRNYLIFKYDWTWINNAMITPNYHDNAVLIYDDNNPRNKIRIVIDIFQHKAYLRDRAKTIDGFCIGKQSDLFLSINAPTNETDTEFKMKFLFHQCETHLQSFLLKIDKIAKSNPDIAAAILKENSCRKTCYEENDPTNKRLYD